MRGVLPDAQASDHFVPRLRAWTGSHVSESREQCMRPSLILLGIYIGVVFLLQIGGLLVSFVVGQFAPTASLMAFLVLFVAGFGFGWPIALRVAFWFMPPTPEERTALARSVVGRGVVGQPYTRSA
jgi:hypothetical protein